MEKSHIMATRERTIRGRYFSARFMVTALRILSKIHSSIYRWTGGSLVDASLRAINRVARALLRVGIRGLNPLMLSLAGSRCLPMLAVIHHRGRRSGRSYATPLGARPIADGFVIPLTFGEQADWFRNVQAAGGCVIRWKGANYPLIDPEVVDWATVRSAFYPVERVVMPIIGIEQFVRLRHAPSSSDVSQN